MKSTSSTKRQTLTGADAIRTRAVAAITRWLNPGGNAQASSLIWNAVSWPLATASCGYAVWCEVDWLTRQPLPYLLPPLLSAVLATVVRIRVLHRVRDNQSATGREGEGRTTQAGRMRLEMSLQALVFLLLDLVILFPFSMRLAAILACLSALANMLSCFFLGESWERAGSAEQRNRLRLLAFPIKV